MQRRFDFGFADITRWRRQLEPLLDRIEHLPPLPPTGQLIKSMISSRTHDPVSQAAYDRLKAQFRNSAQIAAASPAAIEETISDVTHAGRKAIYIVEALHGIRRDRGDFRLQFLGDLPLDAALSWLEALPGVGRKVAASVLNASTLSRPVLIVDSHVMRVLIRLGFVPPNSEARHASEAVTSIMTRWTAVDFLHFHIELKQLGQLCCPAGTPDCDICPLAEDCLTARKGERKIAARKRPPTPSDAADAQLSILL